MLVDVNMLDVVLNEVEYICCRGCNFENFFLINFTIAIVVILFLFLWSGGSPFLIASYYDLASEVLCLLDQDFR